MTTPPTFADGMEAAAKMTRQMRSQLAMYDYLTVENMPSLPPKRRWFRKAKPVYPTYDQEIWAGEVARARTLLDLNTLIRWLEQDAANTKGDCVVTAIQTLKAEIAADAEIAWAWHCNIAMPIMDAAGISHRLANEAAAHLMQHLLDYDITTNEHYQYGKSGAQQYAEMRIASEREEDIAAAIRAAKTKEGDEG